MRVLITVIIVVTSQLLSFGQVSVSSSGTPPDSSAMLDIQSTSSGLLVPRMDSICRQTISSPAEGLLVYDLDTRGFWYFKDSAWVDLNSINRPFEDGGTVIRPKATYLSHDFVIGSPQLENDGILQHNSRLLFNEQKRAFRVGSPRDTADFTTNFISGDATDWDTDSLGYYSFASGLRTKATGDYGSVAMGNASEASGNGAIAIGKFAEATGNDGSVALGHSPEASGNSGAIAIGSSTTASGNGGAVAMGQLTSASGSNGAIAMGRSADVSGNNGSIAAGYEAETTGDFGSIALGRSVFTNGSEGAATLGKYAIANADGSVVIGGGFYDDFDDEVINLVNNIPNSLMVGFQSNIPTFYVGPSGGFSGFTTGKVGIGTSSPQGILHVKKTAFSTGTQVLQVLEAGSGNPTLLFSRGGGGTLSTGMSIEYERTGPDVFHKLYFNGFDANTLMTLHSNGKLGIGTTNPGEVVSSAKLDVEGGHVIVSNNFGFFSENQGGTGLGAGVDTDPADHLHLFANGQSKATLRAEGNFGLGTDSPDRDLTVLDPDGDGSAFINVKDASRELLLGTNSAGASLRSLTNHDLSFWTNNSQRMTVDAGGKVSLNTTAVRTLLTLRGPDHSDDGPILYMFGDGSDQTESGRIRFVESTSSSSWRGGFIHYDGSANEMYIGVHNTSDKLVGNDVNAITIERSSGQVGIGTTSPTALLEVAATTVKKTAGGSWTASSDIRLKQDIHGYTDGLESVLAINPVLFRYNEKSGYNTDEEHIGVIAQELEEIAPYMVSTFNKDGVDYLEVDNSAMTYMLINAVKELSAQNKHMLQEIEILKNALNTNSTSRPRE